MITKGAIAKAAMRLASLPDLRAIGSAQNDNPAQFLDWYRTAVKPSERLFRRYCVTVSLSGYAPRVASHPKQGVGAAASVWGLPPGFWALELASTCVSATCALAKVPVYPLLCYNSPQLWSN